MVKVDKETRRIYADDDPYLQTPEAKTKEFSDKYSSSIYVIEPQKSLVAKFLGINSTGLYAIKIK
ncbi:MAG: hypothetical protein QXV64_00890 [Candidatus Anstonellaceae archaeon]